MYDLLLMQELAEPSLTVQWLPWKTHGGPGALQYELLLGTQSPLGICNYLKVAGVRLPDITDSKAGVCGGCDESLRPKQLKQSEVVEGVEAPDLQNHRVDIQQRITHQGEVLRAAYNPLSPNLVATKSNIEEVHVFDWPSKPPEPAVRGLAQPDTRLRGHSAEGWGLDWSPLQNGLILSGANDGKICYWDIQASSRDLEPLRMYVDLMAAILYRMWLFIDSTLQYTSQLVMTEGFALGIQEWPGMNPPIRLKVPTRVTLSVCASVQTEVHF